MKDKTYKNLYFHSFQNVTYSKDIQLLVNNQKNKICLDITHFVMIVAFLFGII